MCIRSSIRNESIMCLVCQSSLKHTIVAFFFFCCFFRNKERVSREIDAFFVLNLIELDFTGREEQRSFPTIYFNSCLSSLCPSQQLNYDERAAARLSEIVRRIETLFSLMLAGGLAALGMPIIAWTYFASGNLIRIATSVLLEIHGLTANLTRK